MTDQEHTPVMAAQILEMSQLCKKGFVYLDGTFGRGGHATLMERETSCSRMLLMDSDEQAESSAEELIESLKDSQIKIDFKRDRFERMDQFIGECKLKDVDFILLDLGVSSPQLDQRHRGFSFNQSGPLDMRMDDRQSLTAEKLIADLSENDLADLIYQWGEERMSRRIARVIVEERARVKISDTVQLADIIERVMPRRGKIHPATRTFQALRIAVNREIESLEKTLALIPKILAPDGRIVVMSFHSLEDRLVKNCFRQWKKDGLGELITKKCLMADAEEKERNPRSRSAKLRCFKKAT